MPQEDISSFIFNIISELSSSKYPSVSSFECTAEEKLEGNCL